MQSYTNRLLAVLFCGAFIVAPTSQAKVEKLNVTHRVRIADGMAFGAAGAYEKLTGTVRFAFDPRLAANTIITDLSRAPRDAKGMVHARANFMVLQAVDPKRRRGVAFVEVSNRGGKASLRYFNGASSDSADPQTAADLGDGLLLRMGLSVVWVGWQYDIPHTDHRLWLEAPRAQGQSGSITGPVRSDWTLDHASAELSLGHRSLRAFYPVYQPHAALNRLTVRDSRNGVRRVIPRTQWRFSKDGRHITANGGFAAGHIYELVYQAKDPVISGLGLAAVRDFTAYIKHDPRSPFPARWGIAFGVSQTGRFLRHFLYQGFNSDENGRKVFDGMLIHSAGAGRGSFNHRFGQPSRDAHRYSAFFYPTDLFPYSTARQDDPSGGGPAGLLDAYADPARIPKLIETNSGYEYWGRAAALIHAAAGGKTDLALRSQERIYHLAGGQHFVERLPLAADKKRGYGIWQGNPLDYLVNLRALAVRLIQWVADDTAPPASRYPHYADGSLAPLQGWRFPKLPGITAPSVAHSVYTLDYGPRWSQGIIDVQPPRILAETIPPVPVVDAEGQERAGIHNVELRVPLASFLPWSLRTGLPNPGELTDFRGSVVAFPLSPGERRRRADPRRSIASRYRDRADYLGQVETAARALQAEGFLLAEDIPRVLQRATRYWSWLACGDWRDPRALREAAALCGTPASEEH